MGRFMLVFLIILGVFSQPNIMTILFFGDSLTAGYGLSENKAFPALIGENLIRTGLPFKTINGGVSGETTRGGLKRVDWLLKAKPDVVFLALGANDGLRGLDVLETRKNLERIIARFQKEDVSVVLAGMEIPVNYGARYRNSFRRIYPDLAKKFNVPLYPFLLRDVALVTDLNLSDGIHPNERGHAIIARNVFNFIQPILNKMIH